MQTHHARALLSPVAGRGEGGEGEGEVPDESAPAPPRGEQATAAVSEEAGCHAERLGVTSFCSERPQQMSTLQWCDRSRVSSLKELVAFALPSYI